MKNELQTQCLTFLNLNSIFINQIIEIYQFARMSTNIYVDGRS